MKDRMSRVSMVAAAMLSASTASAALYAPVEPADAPLAQPSLLAGSHTLAKLGCTVTNCIRTGCSVTGCAVTSCVFTITNCAYTRFG
ncbi:hypothetical protein WME90_24050 [Sorangium sp. So ce375]|uniref:hypothetical protein n=1 Tax=Sorangium sp. So ce375 TaxID=3133306 RepID=UPI003F5C7376